MIDVLRRAKEVVATKGWCQGVAARDEEDNPTLTYSGRACKFCFHGAIWYALWEIGGLCRIYDAEIAQTITSIVPESTTTNHGYIVLGDWNDDPKRTKKQVLAMYDKIITHLEQQNNDK